MRGLAAFSHAAARKAFVEGNTSFNRPALSASFHVSCRVDWQEVGGALANVQTGLWLFAIQFKHTHSFFYYSGSLLM